MPKTDHDRDPATEPQIVATPTEARGGIISGRVLLVLAVSLTLAVILLFMLGVIGR